MRGPASGVARRTSPKFSDDEHLNFDVHRDHARDARSARPARVCRTRASEKTDESIPMRKTIAKAVTWRLIGTAEIFAISFWTTGHIAMAGHTAGIAAISSLLMYVAHELAWREARPWWYVNPRSCLCRHSEGWPDQPARQRSDARCLHVAASPEIDL